MRLKKLELYGFKSFPSRTEIVFDEGITGIMGPNGSGKSNIADAVRWVLGEQSARTLRGSSMSDVIFNGTQKRKPLSYCEVSLFFDNADRALDVDWTEVMVTRRVYRNGESEYFLNRAACRLKDVVDLFRDTGIGREGYSIIGQGRIDEILSRKSEDRRQVFEEAAGIVKFRARKEEADRKLQRTQENAARVDDILQELERQLGPLEEQSRTAREYLDLSAELKGLDLNLFLVRSDRLRRRLDETDAVLMQLHTSVGDTESALQEKAAERDALQEKLARAEEELQALRAGQMEATERLHTREQDAAALQLRREHRSADRARLTREGEDAALQDSASAEREETTRALAAEKEAGLQMARTALEDAQRREQETAAAEEAAEEALEAHKEAIIDAMNRRSRRQMDETRLTTMRQQMADRLQELDRSAESLREEDAALQEALSAARDTLAAEQAEEAHLGAVHAEAVRSFEAIDAELIRRRQEAEKLAAGLQADHSRWKVLDEMTREMEGYNQSVRRAVAWARETRLSGMKGVLAQLIRVPGEIETAIDMALGAAQQHIVTDTEETAKAMIEHLRQNRLGRATFLPLSAVRPKTLTAQERRVLSMPGCVGVASELIGCDDAFRPIVENLLGRTVIAEDLDSGIAIMRAGSHAFRLVTLAGDVMHSGGGMTGGSVQSRVVNLLGRQRELESLTRRLKEGRADLERRRNELEAAQQRKNDCRAAVSSALEALHQQEIAVARENERVSAAAADCDSHRRRAEEIDAAREQLREQMEEIGRQLEAQTDPALAAQEEQALQEQTEALQEAVARAREAARCAADDVMRLTLEERDLHHALESLRSELKRLAGDRDSLRRSGDERDALLRAMDAEEARDSAGAEALAAGLEQLRADLQDISGRVDAAEESRRAGQESLNTLLHDIDGLHERRDGDLETIHRQELARTRAEADLHALQDRIWNTYELTQAGAEEFRQSEGFNERDADRRAKELTAAIRALGTVNVHAVEEYAESKARYDELSAQQQDLRRAERDLRELIARLLGEMRTTFTDSFTRLQGYFSETFTTLFGGGHAELQLMDPDDPLNCGIEVNAQPPGKKLQLLSLLSGGERALTAIAILFAMLKLKPTPFCILDEIEAALDDANIGYYADYLRQYSEDTQFIVITHRKGTMERCRALYGVSMEEQGVSKMVSVSLQDYRE